MNTIGSATFSTLDMLKVVYIWANKYSMWRIYSWPQGESQGIPYFEQRNETSNKQMAYMSDTLYNDDT